MINRQILDILEKIRPDIDFKKSQNFITEGLLDSVDIVTLVDELEEFFEVSISAEMFVPENFFGLEEIANMIDKCREHQ